MQEKVKLEAWEGPEFDLVKCMTHANEDSNAVMFTL